jgi:hypothetical protein
MQSKGYKVFRPMRISDLDIACYLMSKGYVVFLTDKEAIEYDATAHPDVVPSGLHDALR